MKRPFDLPVIVVLFAVGCLAIAGCGSPPEQTPTEAHLQALAVFYGQYMRDHQGKTPPDEEALKKFISGLSADQQAGMKITDPNELFISPRDNQPYVVLYGLDMGVPSPTGAPMIAYEQTGVNGKRFVAFGMGGVEEVDEARFAQLKPAGQ